MKVKSILILIVPKHCTWPNEIYKCNARVQWYDEHYTSFDWFNKIFKNTIKIEYSDGLVVK